MYIEAPYITCPINNKDTAKTRTTRMKNLIIGPVTEVILDEVVTLHLDAFAGYPNTLLGRRYVTALMKWFINNKGTMAVAAVDCNQTVVGYALTAPMGYTRKLNRDLCLQVATQLLTRPWIIFNRQLRIIILERISILTGLQPNPSPALEIADPTMSLVALGVDPQHQREGIGRRLMSFIEVEAHKSRIYSLVLSVRENAATTRRFYEKCGWQRSASPASKVGVIKYFKLLSQNSGIVE